VGVISLHELSAALRFPPGKRSASSGSKRQRGLEKRVADIMTECLETVRGDTDLGQAVERMTERKVGCLPVVDQEGRLAGLLSQTDALHALVTTLWAQREGERRGARRDLSALIDTLTRERERVSGQIEHHRAAERELAAELHDEPIDDAERAADLREVRLTEVLDEIALRRLDAIDRALDHAAQGRFSVCDGCGEPIPLARLRALPGTTVCVRCSRSQETTQEAEVPFERIPGGRAETGRPELGARVYTRFGEGQLLRVAPFGTCPRCGDVEGTLDPDLDVALCPSGGCRRPLDDVRERAIVGIGEREVYVDPVELSPVDPRPFD
jgi:DnaK suppressor protein